MAGSGPASGTALMTGGTDGGSNGVRGGRRRHASTPAMAAPMTARVPRASHGNAEVPGGPGGLDGREADNVVAWAWLEGPLWLLTA